jgi:hypothetical protein
MTWAARVQPIKVGDEVAYLASFLRSIACYTGHLAQARGKAPALQVISPDVTLAEADWQDDEVPLKVNVKNLVRTSEIGREA